MSERLPTSKPRGVCQYFRSTRGCRNGDMCKFLHGHGETLSPYDKNKTCKFFAAGFCKRGDKCWFRHIVPANTEPVAEDELSTRNEGLTVIEGEDDELVCSICQEKPITYGLLEKCSHVFCLECIRGWREPSGKSQDIVASGNTKKCPYCRTSSRFVTPSSVFYPDGNPLKEIMVANYKASMSRIPCKYFEKSVPGARFCPFGKDCFYQHKEVDGSTFIFDRGADYYMKKDRRRQGQFADIPPLANLTNIGMRMRWTDEITRLIARLRPVLTQQSTSISSVHDDAEEESTSNQSNLFGSGSVTDMLMRLGWVLDSFSVSSSPPENGRREEEEAVRPRPSILATPDESPSTSALPLTRAFMDRNMPLDVTLSLTDVLESDNEVYDHDELSATPDAPHQAQFRRYSLPNQTRALEWADAIDMNVNIAYGTPRSDIDSHSDIEQESLEESVPSRGAIDQESPVFRLADEPEAPDSAPQRASNDSSVNEANSSGCSPTAAMDGRSVECDRESRSKPNAPNEATPRRTKSSTGISTSTTPCSGRRNGGQSFVTDGRGRVVATDDCAYTDGASLAFWDSPTSIAVPQTKSTDESNDPALVGPDALDDLD